jgi:hypothetical protein
MEKTLLSSGSSQKFRALFQPQCAMPSFKSPYQAFKDRVSPQSFAKWCKIALFVWLLGVFIPLNLWWKTDTLNGSSRKWTLDFPNADFSQYYFAGVVARDGLWAHLYPKFKPDSAGVPGRKIWSPAYAEADPEILGKASGFPRGYVLNISPPPEAILCLPLSWFPFTVAFKIWMVGVVLATGGR